MKNSVTAAIAFCAGIAVASLFFTLFRPTGQSQAPPQNLQSSEPGAAIDPNNPCGGFRYGKLPAPMFAKSLPPKLATNRVMEVRVAWDGIDGAKGYNIYVEDKTG